MASGKRKLSGVFGIGRSQDQGVLWSFFLNEEGDQFAGAVSGKNKICRNIAIFGNSIAKGRVFSVRIGGKNVNMCGNGGTALGESPSGLTLAPNLTMSSFFNP